MCDEYTFPSTPNANCLASRYSCMCTDSLVHLPSRGVPIFTVSPDVSNRSLPFVDLPSCHWRHCPPPICLAPHPTQLSMETCSTAPCTRTPCSTSFYLPRVANASCLASECCLYPIKRSPQLTLVCFIIP